jgi:GNAT superfamily N-acetyltransferase
MKFKLKEVQNSRDLRKFINFPLELYKNNPYYVPALFPDEVQTLHQKKNPSFEHCEARYWLAVADNQILGRIAGIINRKHIQKWDEPYMRFGWFDFIDDHAVSAALLSAVEGWAKQNQLTALHGPLGFTDLDREGMLIEGFDELGTLATLYNFPYYPEHMAYHGFVKDTDWLEYELKVPTSLDPKISRAKDLILKRNNLRLLSPKNKQELLSYGPGIFELINKEYNHLYGTVPLSEREIQHYINTYFGFVHPDFIPLIVNGQEELVAFGVAIPSLSKALQKSRGHLFPLGWWRLLRALNRNPRADLYLVAVEKRYQGLGVNLVMMDRLCQVFNQRGIKVVESNPELESNLDVQSQWKILEKRQHKKRRCFIKYF